MGPVLCPSAPAQEQPLEWRVERLFCLSRADQSPASCCLDGLPVAPPAASHTPVWVIV